MTILCRRTVLAMKVPGCDEARKYCSHHAEDLLTGTDCVHFVRRDWAPHA